MKIITNHKKNSFLSIKNIKKNQVYSFKIKITKKIHFNFLKFSGDKSPLHYDLKFCKKNNFKGIVGYAFLITTILSQIYGIYIPGGSELCLRQTCNFKKPFFIGDELNVKITIIGINKFSKTAILSSKIKNQKNINIFEGQATLLLNLKNEDRTKKTF